MSSITAAQLNSMSIEERRAAASGEFGKRMLQWAGSHVTYFRWLEQTASGPEWRNGSIFFLDFDGSLLAVTARHVYTEYLSAKRAQPTMTGYIENLPFDFEHRLAGLGDSNGGPDIATFQMTYDELVRVKKQVVASPSLHPFSDQTGMIVGFPRASVLPISTTIHSYGLNMASLRVNSASDQQITLPFEREFWVDSLGRGTPPQGFNLGGMSGGPLLLPIDTGEGVFDFRLAGIIREFSPNAFATVETVVCVAAHFIQPDGSINPNSAPINHATRPRQAEGQSQ